MWKRNMSAVEAADLIERFLRMRSTYPQEWNDFVDTSQDDPDVERYRSRCYELDPLVNRPAAPEEAAVAELENIVGHLRSL